MRVRSFIAAAALILTASHAMAQAPPREAVPLLKLSRLAVAGGANYDWHSGEAVTPRPTFRKEFTAGAYAAYVLVDPVTLYGAAVYGVDNRVVRFSPGAHVRVQPHIALTLTYDYYAGHTAEIPTYPHEWAAGIIYSRPLGRIVVGGSETYGFDNREWRTSVGIRAPFFLGKDS
jgi:hypothetical protein